MTIGSFVCTKCSGMLRGITPPHRIKSMSMSSFSAEEVSFLKSRGNVWCSKVWMGLYDKGRSVAPDSKELVNQFQQRNPMGTFQTTRTAVLYPVLFCLRL